MEFSDERVWQCGVASSPELDSPVYLYSRRDDDEMTSSIRKLLQNNSIRMTIDIKSVSQSHRHRQFVMTRILHGD